MKTRIQFFAVLSLIGLTVQPAWADPCGIITLADALTGRRYGTAELVDKMADVLQHAHDGGVVHRDLKPSNIMLTSELPFRGNQRMLLHQVINDDAPRDRSIVGVRSG